jgi:hypothetical protein
VDPGAPAQLGGDGDGDAAPRARARASGAEIAEGSRIRRPCAASRVDAFLPDQRAVFARAALRGGWDLTAAARLGAGALAPLARVPVRAGYARDPLRRAFTHALPPPTEAGRRVPSR